MTTSEQYYIHSLLEPDERIITGNHKRYHELKRELVKTLPGPDTRTEAEIERAEDEYLKTKGV
jgi:hypothetical protein